MKPRYILSRPGIVSALGCGTEETARRMDAADVSGMKLLEGCLPDGETTYFGFARMEEEKFAAAPDRVTALIREALGQIAPEIDVLRSRVPARRIGVVAGTSNSTMAEFTARGGDIDMACPARRIAGAIGAEGPAWAVSTACSSSAKAFASARRLIESGVCDAVAVGGADAFTSIVAGGFGALEAVSPRRTRPLAADRDGINLGEGAAIFVMRPAEEGEGGITFAGSGESSDAYHLTAPDPEGKGAEAAMRAALADAGTEPCEIDYVNLHGTGTIYNDTMECAAVRRVFGDRVPCGSTKPLTGHALGAAGAIEAAICWIALERGRGLPPHAVEDVDRALAPFPVPRRGDTRRVRAVLSNSFAFGGSNAAIVLRSEK